MQTSPATDFAPGFIRSPKPVAAFHSPTVQSTLTFFSTFLGEINIEGATCNVFTAMVVLTAPEKVNAPLPNLPKGEPTDGQQPDFRFSLMDIPGKAGLGLNGQPWKIVKTPEDARQDEGTLRALVHLPDYWDEVIAEGSSDGAGSIQLSTAQKMKVWETTTRHPGCVWVIHGLHATPVTRSNWVLGNSPENSERIMDALNHATDASPMTTPEKDVLEESLKNEYAVRKLAQLKSKTDC